MYVVLHGTVAIGSDEAVIDRIEAGGLFGEMALIDDAPRSASAWAETHVTLSPVDKERFHDLVARTPHFAVQVMSVMAGRLRRLLD
jgi:CRP-like cAMP-binding protein